MKILTDLLRNLLYHLTGPHRQGRMAVATILAATGINVLSLGNGTSLLQYLEHVPHLMVSIVGSAVILNIILKHINEVLERLVKEGWETETESRRTLALLTSLFGGRKDNRDAAEDSKNTDDGNIDTPK